MTTGTRVTIKGGNLNEIPFARRSKTTVQAQELLGFEIPHWAGIYVQTIRDKKHLTLRCRFYGVERCRNIIPFESEEDIGKIVNYTEKIKAFLKEWNELRLQRQKEKVKSKKRYVLSVVMSTDYVRVMDRKTEGTVKYFKICGDLKNALRQAKIHAARLNGEDLKNKMKNFNNLNN